MVSVRRPGLPRHPAGAATSSKLIRSTSLLAFRCLLIVFILYQSYNVALKFTGRGSTSQRHNTQTAASMVHAKQPGLRKPAVAAVDHHPPPVKVVKDHGGLEAHHDKHTDHTDDHAASAALVQPGGNAAETKKHEPEELEDLEQPEHFPEDHEQRGMDHHQRNGEAEIKKDKTESHEAPKVPQPPLEHQEKVQQNHDKQPKQQEQHNHDTAHQVANHPRIDKVSDPKAALVLSKVGTGPTKLGYVVDLVQERLHPSFREASVPSDYAKWEKELANVMMTKDGHAAAAADAGSVAFKSCEYLQGRQLLERSICRDVDTVLYAYNSAPFPRYLCGHQLDPGQGMKLEERCEEAVHLFVNDEPPVSGQGMAPIVVQAKEGPMLDKEKLESVECDIPCQFDKELMKPVAEHVQRKMYIQGTNWKILHTEANPYFREYAKVERTSFRQDVYYSTHSFQSSIPLSSYSFDKYYLRNRPALDWKAAANKATYVLDSDCNINGGSARRQKWYAAVEAVMPTASYGSCHHNADLVQGETVSTMEGRVALAKKNRIHLAFESGIEKDYTTPIVWESLLSGAVPAILGAANLDDLLPPKSAILCSNFNTWDKFAATVKEISSNQTLWESYQKWRTDETALAAFEKKFSFTKTSSQCRTCRWAYAKKYGLGWDHQQQAVKETYIPRRLCIDDSSKMVTKPFREAWVGHSSTVASESCKSLTFESIVEGAGYKVNRRIYQHDGITDIYIKSVTRDSSNNEDIVMLLEVDVKNLEGAYFPNTHTLVPTVRSPLVSSGSIQDQRSKVTVLANWETEIRSPQAGMLELVIERKGQPILADETRRLRIFTEDFSELHDKPTEFFPSSFGKMVTKDFVDPLQFFYSSA